MSENRHEIYNYLRTSKKFPSDWCPGCGVGIFLRALIRSIDKSSYSKDEIVLISGIGCTGRITTYVDFNTLHTTHGRALTFATGVKLAKPELKVIVIMGDGDAVAIGGNHFIHAARRNMEITAIVINNSIYGMTGGQLSPCTPPGMNTATSPYGVMENPLDICELATVAGSNFVARSTIYHVGLMEKLIYKSINSSGFSVLEIISQCPVQYGKRAGFNSPAEALAWQRDNTVSIDKAAKLSEEQLQNKIKTGILTDRKAETYHDKLERSKERIDAL